MSANDKQIAGKHYRKPIQTWDYIHRNGIGYLAGNAIKYLSRYQDKNGLEDLKKAQHYVEKLIEEWENKPNLPDVSEEEEQFMREVAIARARDGV